MSQLEWNVIGGMTIWLMLVLVMVSIILWSILKWYHEKTIKDQIREYKESVRTQIENDRTDILKELLNKAENRHKTGGIQ